MSVEASQISQEVIPQVPRYSPIVTEIVNPFVERAPIPDAFIEAFQEALPPVPNAFGTAFSDIQLDPNLFSAEPGILVPEQEIVTAAEIHDKITRARERVARRWRAEGVVRQYEPVFDQIAYRILKRYQFAAPMAYLEARKQLDAYTDMQLNTAVAERLNAALSEWQYDVNEEGIFGQNTNERAIKMFERGRDFRRENGNPIDWPREDAEVEGFGKMETTVKALITQHNLEAEQSKITKPKTVGFVSASGKGDVENGSIYGHNFYDIHVFTITADGKKLMESRRYTSGLTPEMTYEKLGRFDRENYPEGKQPTVEHFLANPIKIDLDNGEFEDADAIHKHLHVGTDAFDSKQIKAVHKWNKPNNKAYIRQMNLDPDDREEQLAHLRGVFNGGDMAGDLISGKSGGSRRPIEDLDLLTPLSQQQMVGLRSQPVEVKKTPCGNSGVENGSAYSVSDFGGTKAKDALKEAMDDPNNCPDHPGVGPHFDCPGTVIDKKTKKEKPCEYKVLVGSGVEKCPECGMKATCA